MMATLPPPVSGERIAFDSAAGSLVAWVYGQGPLLLLVHSVNAAASAAGQLQRRCGPAPADALAVSLGCEFLARAATERPAAFRSLALVSPTGFRGTGSWRAEPGRTRAVPGLLRALRGPGDLWGGALFRALTRPGVIRYFLFCSAPGVRRRSTRNSGATTC
jgi:hypothetical protein